MHFVKVIIFICCLRYFTAFSQTTNPTDMIINQIVESTMNSYSDNQPDLTDLTNKLYFYQENPININNAKYSELKSIYILNDIQIYALYEHIRKYGPILEIAELQTIEYFDEETIQKLKYFITTNNSGQVITLRDVVKNGQNEAFIRYSTTLQTSKGYTDSSYLGSKESILGRYSFKYNKNIYAGFSFQKDAGEPIFNKYQKGGFDSYSGFVGIKDIGVFNSLVIGDYLLQYGQGVAMWRGYAIDKSAMVLNIAKCGEGVKPYRSSSENGFFRGFASDIKVSDNINVSPFVSYRKIDASTVIIDDNEYISSIINSGYHRTESEIENKGSVKEIVYGASVQSYFTDNLNIGITSFNSSFDIPFASKNKMYQLYNFDGNSQSFVSVNYGYNLSRFLLFGENAYSSENSFGLVNGVLFSVSSKTIMTIAYRHYDKDYNNIYSNSIGESSRNTAEQGLYYGTEFRINPKLKVLGYADFFDFEWLSYHIDAPSNGYDFKGQVAYNPSKKLQLNFKAGQESKDKNKYSTNSIVSEISNTTINKYQFDYSYLVYQNFSIGNNLCYNAYNIEGGLKENGASLALDVGIKNIVRIIDLDFRIALFDTDSYNTKIYNYEKQILYNYSWVSYQNTGTRFYANTKLEVIKNLDLWFRVSTTKYKNIDQISSGYNTILDDSKTDFTIQSRYIF